MTNQEKLAQLEAENAALRRFIAKLDDENGRSFSLPFPVSYEFQQIKDMLAGKTEEE